MTRFITLYCHGLLNRGKQYFLRPARHGEGLRAPLYDYCILFHSITLQLAATSMIQTFPRSEHRYCCLGAAPILSCRINLLRKGNRFPRRLILCASSEVKYLEKDTYKLCSVPVTVCSKLGTIS